MWLEFVEQIIDGETGPIWIESQQVATISQRMLLACEAGGGPAQQTEIMLNSGKYFYVHGDVRDVAKRVTSCWKAPKEEGS